MVLSKNAKKQRPAPLDTTFTAAFTIYYEGRRATEIFHAYGQGLRLHDVEKLTLLAREDLTLMKFDPKAVSMEGVRYDHKGTRTRVTWAAIKEHSYHHQLLKFYARRAWDLYKGLQDSRNIVDVSYYEWDQRVPMAALPTTHPVQPDTGTDTFRLTFSSGSAPNSPMNSKTAPLPSVSPSIVTRDLRRRPSTNDPYQATGNSAYSRSQSARLTESPIRQYTELVQSTSNILLSEPFASSSQVVPHEGSPTPALSSRISDPRLVLLSKVDDKYPKPSLASRLSPTVNPDTYPHDILASRLSPAPPLTVDRTSPVNPHQQTPLSFNREFQVIERGKSGISPSPKPLASPNDIDAASSPWSPATKRKLQDGSSSLAKRPRPDELSLNGDPELTSVSGPNLINIGETKKLLDVASWRDDKAAEIETLMRDLADVGLFEQSLETFEGLAVAAGKSPLSLALAGAFYARKELKELKEQYARESEERRRVSEENMRLKEALDREGKQLHRSERMLADFKREADGTFVVPGVLEAFERIARYTNAAMEGA
ncbi:hypothetical protein BXZ70DRAFT_924932 [Cristinia sonorae]|uniref:Uncharacterized protein n=1 Tax=Cristinia sonorae TaxID=1940300 RepID=A0A8K0USS5_9AGAR|nr:hypothetical protein BXZ70DRAFT_924932 [Cristinia sonorae]